MTAELCLEDIKQNNSALRFIPDHLKIAGVYVEVIRQNRIALNCSPEQYKKQFSFPLKPLWDINLVKELKLILDNPNLKIKNINQ